MSKNIIYLTFMQIIKAKQIGRLQLSTVCEVSGMRFFIYYIVIGDEELMDIPELSFDKMLAGKVAGVQVTATSGQPGAATQIRIRGTSSLNAGN